MKIDFIKEKRLSFYQMTQKYNMTISEVMEQYKIYKSTIDK